MQKPTRKINRLQQYDYSKPNAYFITICTEKRKNLFWDNHDFSITDLNQVNLSPCGKLVQESINNIPVFYPQTGILASIIMPNHIHLVLQIQSDELGNAINSVPISRIIQQMKGYVSKKYGSSIWQKGFHDHIIRGKEELQTIMEYVIYNPLKWKDDKYFEG